MLRISKAPVILEPNTLHEDVVTENSEPVKPVRVSECETIEYGATPPVIGPEYDPVTTLLNLVMSHP
jgi:hypothetical protein